MDWKYYKPEFEYEETLNDLRTGHKHFAYDFIRNIKPHKILELAARKRTPFFSFCQAVKDGELDTELIAWNIRERNQWDQVYGESDFEEFNKIKETYYPNQTIRLLETAIEGPLDDSLNNSIDLLHIDGFQTYEEVKHDFEFWFGRIKGEGVIIIDGIAEKSKELGVHKLWDELKKKYKTVEFQHSQGLGILFKDTGTYNNLINNLEIWQCYYPLIDENRDLSVDLKNKNQELTNLKLLIQRKDQEIYGLNQTIRQIEYDIENYKPTIVDLMNQVADLETNLKNIHNSNGWKLLSWYYGIWDKLLPGNTEGRLWFRNNVRKILKAILNPSSGKNA